MLGASIGFIAALALIFVRVPIAIALADGDSGEVLALIKDTRRGDTNTWGINNSVTNMGEVRRAFSSWAMRIHDGLLALKARGENSGS